MRRKVDYSEEKEILRNQMKRLAEDSYHTDRTAQDTNAMCKMYCLLKVERLMSSVIFKVAASYLLVGLNVHVIQSFWRNTR